MVLIYKRKFLNFIVLCCHYSTRYVNAENYALARQDSFKNEVFFLKKMTKEVL